MGAAAIGLIIIGYGFAYSGISNLVTGGKGWGLLHALANKQTGNTPISFSSFVSQIQPQGNSGSSTPDQGSSPVGGTVSV